MSGHGKDATIAARVPRELRVELEAKRAALAARGVHYPDGKPVDLSYVIRVGLRHYLDCPEPTAGHVGVARETTLGSLEHEPRSHRNDPNTARRAAGQAWPKANTDRRRALELVADAGARGVTGDDLDVVLGGYNGRRRLSELKAGGWVEPRLHTPGLALAADEQTGPRPAGDPVDRLTRNRAWARVYVLTATAEVRLLDEGRLAA